MEKIITIKLVCSMQFHSDKILKCKSFFFFLSKHLISSRIRLLVDSKADVNTSNPIFAACKNKNFFISSYLIEKKALINVRDTNDDTPLHLSSIYFFSFKISHFNFSLKQDI